MDVTLDALVGAAQTPVLARTNAAGGVDPTGAFDALIAALSNMPAVFPPAPPVEWTGNFGLPTPVNAPDLDPVAAPPGDEPVEMLVGVPLHLIPGVVVPVVPVVPVVAQADAVAVIVPSDGEQNAPSRPVAMPVAVPVAMPAAVPVAMLAAVPVAMLAAVPVPVSMPTPSVSAQPPAAPLLAAPLIAAFKVGPQPDVTEPAISEAETPTGEPTVSSPDVSVLRTLGQVAAPTQAATPAPVATYDKRATGPVVPRVTPREPESVVAPTVPLAAVPEPMAAPVPSTTAATLPTPAMPMPGQVVEQLAPSLATPVAPTAAPPPMRPTTEDGQPLESRLVEVMRWQAKEGGGRVEIKLRPEYLGALTVTLQMEGGVVKASLAAESQSTRDFLQSEAGHLKTALEDHGFTLGAFEIRDDREAPEERPQQQRQHQPHGSKRPTRDRGDVEAGETFDVIV